MTLTVSSVRRASSGEKGLAGVVALRERDLERARNDLERFQRFLGDGDD